MNEMIPRHRTSGIIGGGSAFAFVSVAFVRPELGDACSPLSSATRQSPMASAAPPVSAAALAQRLSGSIPW
jgi:hypothetical protein